MSTDEFEHHDAAYVLGALSGADRHRFEAHLQTCDDCVERVAALQGLPRLLAQAPESAFGATVTPAVHAGGGAAAGGPAPDMLPRLLGEVAAYHRRRRVLGLAGLLTAAAAVAVLIAVLFTTGRSGDPDRAPAQAQAMTNVVPVQMLASVQVVRRDSRDQVNLWCTYESDRTPPDGGNYLAVAISRNGRREVIGSWPAIPGQTAVVRTPTTFRAGQVAAVEVTSATGVTLARTRFDPATGSPSGR